MGNKAVRGAIIGGVLLGPVGAVAGGAIGADKDKERRERRRREEEARRQREAQERAEAERRAAEERRKAAEAEARRQEQLRREQEARAQREREEAERRRRAEQERQRVAAERARKQQELRCKESQMSQVNARLQEKNASLQNEERKLQALNARVNQEEKEISHFQAERSDPSRCRVMVAMGMTGSGKSTICNRLSGDVSEDGDQGFFKVSHDLDSETKEVTKRVVTHSASGLQLAIVDTPGANDSENRDRTFTNQLVAYLRGSGGVNSFLVFFDLSNARFAESYKKYLFECKERFGANFWNHVVIVATKADCVRANKLAGKVQSVIQHFKQTLGLASNLSLECVAIGHNNYKEAMNELVGKVKANRFDCSAIKSPIDDLKRERDAQTGVVNSVRSQKNSIAAQRSNLQSTINNLRRSM